jgi:transcriptional regulator with XRE-family HTH domain
LKTRSFGRALEWYRNDLGLTQAKMAEAIDVSVRYYQALEADQKEPSLKTLQKALKGLDVSYDKFFDISKRDARHANQPESGSPPGRIPDIGFAGSLLQQIQTLKPARQQFVLALTYDEPKYLELADLRQSFQLLRKSL